MNQYVVLQVTLKEKLIGTASKNLKELEDVINAQAAKGYRLHHTITTASANSTGFGGGDRIPGYYGIRETLMLLHRCNFSKI